MVREAAVGILGRLRRRVVVSDPWHQVLASGFRSWSQPGRTFSSGAEDGIKEFEEEMAAVFGTPLATGSPLSHTRGASGGGESQPGCRGLDSGNALSHVDDAGKAAMVDVSGKAESRRKAVASGKVILGQKAFALVAANQIEKGDVLTVAKIAGICGAKQTSHLIPLCHSIMLSGVDVTLTLDDKSCAVDIRAEASAVGPTGVEMEALTAVSVASLTVYDMCKAVSKDIQVCSIQLESKTGGKSGSWQRGESEK